MPIRAAAVGPIVEPHGRSARSAYHCFVGEAGEPGINLDRRCFVARKRTGHESDVKRRAVRDLDQAREELTAGLAAVAGLGRP
jgi:hypothetical protein